MGKFDFCIFNTNNKHFVKNVIGEGAILVYTNKPEEIWFDTKEDMESLYDLFKNLHKIKIVHRYDVAQYLNFLK